MTRPTGRLLRSMGVAVLAAAVCMAGPAAAGAAAGRAAAGPGEVPAGFKANSITWLSPVQGWILGAAPCGANTCTDVIGTTNGGRTWGLLGTIGAAIPEMGSGQSTGVTDIRFVTPELGFAFAPDLYVTGNGGRSWAQLAIPGNGKQVLDLATGAGRGYAVVSPCAFGTGLCSAAPLSFWRTTTSTGRSWASVPLKLALSLAALVSAYGSTVYVVDESSGQADRTARDEFYASTDGGKHFSTRPDPCALPQKNRGLSGVAATSGTAVALLCVGSAGVSQAEKTAYRSVSTGQTDLYVGQVGFYGIQSELAMSPSGNLAVASVSDGSFIYINDTAKTTWTMVIGYGDGGAGWNDISYVTDSEAWVVYGPADSPADLGKVFVTHNAGRSWDVVAL
jgi:hypothetical protein